MSYSSRLQSGDVVLVRAAVLPLRAQHTRWPDLDRAGDCRRWLSDVWTNPAFTGAVHSASPQLGRAVDRILHGEETSPKRVRKAAAATARYLLRAAGRPTPFGLFAGVTIAERGSTDSHIGTEHQAHARPDTLWLHHVRRDLQRRPDVLPHLSLQVNDLTTRRGAAFEHPVAGGRLATTPITPPLDTVLALAGRHPFPYREVADQLAALGGTEQQINRLLTDALEAELLTSGLAAPMTESDPLSHMLRTLRPLTDRLHPETRGILDELDEVHQLLTDHNRARTTREALELRTAAEKRMHAVSTQGRVRLSVDLRLDATVRIPPTVLTEAEHAANALLRLTRNVGEKPTWSAYHGQFWERYGAGSLVPLRDAVDLAAGVGLPADFPLSLWPEPPIRALPRDELLMTKAWQAALSGAREIQLSEQDIDALDATTGRAESPSAPHVEMAVRVLARSKEALERGDFTVAVRPAWSTGTLTGRFAATLPDSGLSQAYRKLPTLVEGAITAQLSFTPLHPHAENVARTPALLPYVIPVGEHREPADNLIPLDDLAVLSTSRRLHLVSLSRRRVVEPLVPHPLALEKQAPPIARFIALVGRGFATAWTQFDWGPLAAGLPYLPRVRYRQAILSPARWRLTGADLPTGPYQAAWQEALTDWARTSRCPQTIELRDDDRTLRLDLHEPLHARLLHSHLHRHGSAELLEAPAEEDCGWIGHAHELTLPLVSTQTPLPHPDVAAAPIVTNAMLPTPSDEQQRWVQAKLFTHPTAMDQILTRHLPELLTALGNPASWYVRYRTPHEEDHLRLRTATASPDDSARVTRGIARWAAGLQGQALASRLVFDGYRPEFGRYGTGPALDAAEAVFVTDSEVTRYALTDLNSINRPVLTALGMIDIARGFLGDEEGTRWLATTTARASDLQHVARQTLQLATAGRTDDPWTQRLRDASGRRHAALLAYRQQVADGQATPVLESLLHMHHNRVMGPDREAEAVCRHAARQTCHSLLAQADRR